MGGMTALESPRPRRRAFWVDARFALGLLLVVASVVGVWFVISAARQTVSVFAAAHTIVPGQVLSGDDLRPVDVALGQVGDAYLAGGALEEGLVATRTVPAGELVPQSAVGPAAAARTTSVVVHSAVDVPAVVGEGSVVEVWAAPIAGARLRHAAHPHPGRDRRLGDPRRVDDRGRLGSARTRDPPVGGRRRARRGGRGIRPLRRSDHRRGPVKVLIAADEPDGSPTRRRVRARGDRGGRGRAGPRPRDRRRRRLGGPRGRAHRARRRGGRHCRAPRPSRVPHRRGRRRSATGTACASSRSWRTPPMSASSPRSG